MFELRGSKAIVTGGARGFGREFAMRLLGAGSKVVIADIMEDEAKNTVNELGVKYGNDSVTYVR